MLKNPKLCLFLTFCCSVAAQNISTIAGGGPHNLAALQTGFPNFSGMAVDHSGNVFVSLAYANQIWKVDTSGRVNLFAGSGPSNYLGDGGPALSASFCNPGSLAFDTAGSLYIADSCNGRVRKISTSGIVTTVAGGFYAGNSNGDGSLATAAYLTYPVGLALDSANNLYIADRYAQRIRLVSAATGKISTVAGNGTSGFSGDGGPATSAMLSSPSGVAVDSIGSIYIADSYNYRVRKVSPSGTISTAVGTGSYGSGGDGGNATLASLSYVQGVAVDQFDDVFILEPYDVREIPAGQSNIITFAGSTGQGYSGDGSSPTSAQFSYLVAMAFDSNLNLYLADTGNFHIRKVSLTTVTTIAGNGTQYYDNDGPALNDSLNGLNSIAVDNAGSLYITDSSSSVRKLVLATGQLSTVAGTGTYASTPDGGAATLGLLNASALTVDSGDNYYFVESNRIRKVTAGVLSTVANSAGGYGFSGDGGPARSALLYYPSSLAVATNGDLYIADQSNNRVRVINAQTGIITTVAGSGVSGASTGDGGLATSATFSSIKSLALDGNGNLFICDQYQGRVRKVNLSTNIITTVAGNGTSSFVDNIPATSAGIYYPESVVVDQSGNLFIAEYYGYRVRKVTAATGIISTVAGNGSAFSNGDGGSAVGAGVPPVAIALDRAQNLYVADQSGRIRMTQVSACFFTISSLLYSVVKTGGTGTLTVTGTNSSCPYSVSSNSPYISITSGATGTGSGTVMFSVAANAGTNRTGSITLAGQTFTFPQAGTPTQANVGYFQPSGPSWVLDSNGNGTYDSGDLAFNFAGQPGAIAVVGDWNGDGHSKIGYYLNGFWALDYNGDGIFNSADKFYAFGGGDSSYIPIVGDWTGTGTTKIGYYRAGFWALDMNGNGTFDAGDAFYAYGGNGTGEVPVIGDWNGDKRTKIGFYYKGLWALDYNGDGSFNVTTDKYYNNFTYSAGDKPVTGDWTGTGSTKIGIFRGGFWILDANGNGTFDGVAAGDKFYGFGGAAGDMPITADWNGDGKTKIGVYNTGFWTLDLNGNGTYDSGDRFLAYYGGAGSQPIVGHW